VAIAPSPSRRPASPGKSSSSWLESVTRLLDRPLTSYQLVLGVTALLLSLAW
jgi:hypothetical protein